MQTPDRGCERRWKGDDGEWYPRFQMRSTIYGALIMYVQIRANTSKFEIAERYGGSRITRIIQGKIVYAVVG
jgi:hypothetical protein